MDKWILKNCEELRGKKVVVTGATGGLGKIICMDLASLGAHIILACRNKNKADNLKAEILGKFPQTTVDFVPLNLSSFESVKSAIEGIQKYNGIDILINNAGIYNVPFEIWDSGFNSVFQTNFVYTYYFTKKLIPELEKCENSTCITVGSIAHNYSKINVSDLDFSTNKKNTKIYGNSKRFLMFSMLELFKNSRVNLVIAHPGVTLTNMTNHYPKAINWLVKIGIKLVFPSPKKAVRSIILATNPLQIKNATLFLQNTPTSIDQLEKSEPRTEHNTTPNDFNSTTAKSLKQDNTFNRNSLDVEQTDLKNGNSFTLKNQTKITPPAYYWLGPKLFNIWGNPKFQKLTTATTEEIEKISSLAEDIFNKLDK